MAHPALRQAFDARKFIVAPGIFDMISAKVADGMGFDCLYGTGFGTVASHLGVPDAGIATYTDMVTRMGQMARGVRTPMIADADTGYGGLLNVRHTVMGYEAAGISGIQLEDQEMPKKCGHTPGRRVIPAEEMVLKIKVAAEARTSPDFLIVARTDARTTLGLEEAIRRGRMFGEAGADMVFIESPESEEEMRAIGKAHQQAAAREHGRGRAHAAAAGGEAAGDRLRHRDLSGGRLPGHGGGDGARLWPPEAAWRQHRASAKSYGFKRMTELMGFPEVWDFEKRWAQPEAAKAAE